MVGVVGAVGVAGSVMFSPGKSGISPDHSSPGFSVGSVVSSLSRAETLLLGIEKTVATEPTRRIATNNLINFFIIFHTKTYEFF